MRKVTAIIGVPGCGKSRVMQELLGRLGHRFWNAKWTPYHTLNFKQTAVLGRYDEPHKYPGTDRLSMAVQPHALKMIAETDHNVLFEGDRLGNEKMFQSIAALPDIDFLVIHLGVADDVLNGRRDAERADQDEKFWRSRKTKIINIKAACIEAGIPIRHFWNNQPRDSQLIASFLYHNRV